jgi:hypothetical protein
MASSSFSSSFFELKKKKKGAAHALFLHFNAAGEIELKKKKMKTRNFWLLLQKKEGPTAHIVPNIRKNME